MKENRYVIFIDIKEFSYKNALLTDKQVEKILHTFEDIVVQASKAFEVEIVKSIGDAYMVLAKSPDEAYNFSLWVIGWSQTYDNEQKIDLSKVAVRIGINYGEVTKNVSMSLDDYFWDAINLAARIVDMTPAGHIFCSAIVSDMIKNGNHTSLWEFDFHGVISPTPIWSLTEISNKEISWVLQKSSSLYKDCDTIVYQSACVSAILSAQPLPFIESFNIIGIHLYMIMKISQKFWRPVNLQSGKKIFTDVISPLGLTYMTLQWANTVVKILLPWIWGYLYIPLSFAMTYALWKVYTAYFFYDMWWKKLSDSMIKTLFYRQKNSGKMIAKKRKKEILATGKSVYKDIMSIKKATWYYKVQSELKNMLSSKK